MLALVTSSGTGLMMSSNFTTEHRDPSARTNAKHCAYRTMTYQSIGSTYETASTLHDHLGGLDYFPEIPLEFNFCFCTLTIGSFFFFSSCIPTCSFCQFSASFSAFTASCNDSHDSNSDFNDAQAKKA